MLCKTLLFSSGDPFCTILSPPIDLAPNTPLNDPDCWPRTARTRIAGFYQFIPELFFTAFIGENGYRIVDIIAFENLHCTKRHRVKGPQQVGRRVNLANYMPTYLLFLMD